MPLTWHVEHGTIVEQLAYGPRFQNQQTNTSTGLLDMGAREYDPSYGFISPDPLTDVNNPAAFNPYAYSAHSPVTRSDPSGLDPGGNCLVTGGCNWQVDKCAGKPKVGECAGIRDRGGNSGDGLTDQEKEDLEKAKKIKEQTAVDLLLEHGLKFLLDFLGITDIVNCFTKGDIGACVSAAAGMVPVTKIFSMAGKIGKGIWKAFKAWKVWKAAAKWADDVIEKIGAKLAKKADEGPAPGCTHSFDPDTPVRMADGTNKPIKDIDVGDSVEATDPYSGVTTSRQVTHTHNNLDTELTKVTVAAADGGTDTIETTPHHPFWATNAGRWIDAGGLSVGTVLLTSDGSRVVVTAVQTFATAKWMRDLTVSGVHTYYVAAADEAVLVHNCTPGPEAAHARASETAARSTNPGTSDGFEGATGGLFRSDGLGFRDLVSSRPYQGYRAPRGVRPGYETHVEAQAASFMRDGEVAHLMISHPLGVCGACSGALSAMLPRGSTLHVTFQHGRRFYTHAYRSSR